MYRRLTIVAILTAVVATIAATPAADAVTAHERPTSARHMLTAALTVQLMPAASATSQARVRLPRPIYFWGSVANIIRAPGQHPLPEVIRPSAILLFADGSWVIGHCAGRAGDQGLRTPEVSAVRVTASRTRPRESALRRQVKSPCRTPGGSTVVRCTVASRLRFRPPPLICAGAWKATAVITPSLE
jgi:hypothetical protein